MVRASHRFPSGTRFFWVCDKAWAPKPFTIPVLFFVFREVRNWNEFVISLSKPWKSVLRSLLKVKHFVHSIIFRDLIYLALRLFCFFSLLFNVCPARRGSRSCPSCHGTLRPCNKSCSSRWAIWGKKCFQSVFSHYFMAELVFRSWRTLIGCWDVRKKKRIALPGAVRGGQNAFLRTCKFWRENFWVDLNKNKKGLGNVRCKSSNNNTSWNIGVAFLESCLSICEANECLTSVNMKRNQETQR